MKNETMLDGAITIVIVEDDRDDVFIIRRAIDAALVDHAPAKYAVVHDGTSALDYLRQQSRQSDSKPDLLILDLNMPGMGGMQFLQALRSEPSLRPSKVVVFTTSFERAILDRAKEAGADEVWSKPTLMPEYYSVMKNVLASVASTR